ncbi:Por secretion system C-terminal sorting domain-containing protein [Saccharicrinis carchari]|uniref:Por secretion system C-terminal sorting domain-containing protein n=1 Tax=Saccharicrinis carchari TaxID=1168039 RepID=A0A521EKN4_SACCC|nr:T9SS type A sorting domain-containing protein [Saccharicrinis carchari]SMO84031.1 Por secretion system C-terminal sorting domain-containing protein [Saccharicrinis carchari]
MAHVKHLLLLALLIGFNLSAYAQDVTLLDFESDNLNMGAWNGVAVQRVSSSDIPAGNLSAYAIEYTHPGNNWWGGAYFNDLAQKVDVTVTPYVKFKVYSSSPVYIQAKLEGGDNGNNYERGYQLSHDQLNKWTEVVFNFGTVTDDNNYGTLVVWFDAPNNYAMAGSKFYLDDIVKTSTAPAGKISFLPSDNSIVYAAPSKLHLGSYTYKLQKNGADITNSSLDGVLYLKNSANTDIPFTAELNEGDQSNKFFSNISITPSMALMDGTYTFGIVDNTLTYADGSSTAVNGSHSSFTIDSNGYGVLSMYEDFDTNSNTLVVDAVEGTVSEVANPSGAGKVAMFNKGENEWGRIHYELNRPVDLSAGKVFSFDVYHSATADFRFKLSEIKGDGGVAKEIDLAYTTPGAWQTLTVDFSDVSFADVDFNHILIYPLGADTKNANIYFDNLQGAALQSATISFLPAEGATEINGFTDKLTIKSNVKLLNADGSEITDLSARAYMKKGIDDFTDFEVAINEDKTLITFTLTKLPMNISTQYTFGINDNAIKFHDEAGTLTGLESTFTSNAINPSSTVVYSDYETVELINFGSWNNSSKFEKVANPAKDAVNGSDNVGAYIHGGGDAGIGDDLPGNVNFVATPYFRIKVWSAHPALVRLKLENNPDWGTNREIGVQLKPEQTGKWTELFFDFSGTAFTNLNKIVLTIDPSSTFYTAGDKIYFDDIVASNTAPQIEMTSYPTDNAVGAPLIGTYYIKTNLSFDLPGSAALTNANLGDYWKLRKDNSAGAEVAAAINFDAAQNMLQLTPLSLLDANTSYWLGVPDGDLSYSSGDVVNGLNITFTTGEAPVFTMYNDFDGTDVTTVVEGMGDPAGALNPGQLNPDGSFSFVAQWDKGTSWGGWERIHVELNKAIDFTEDNVISLKVYSPKATFVRLKVGTEKDNEGGIYKETDAQVTTIDGWQTLYFGLGEMPSNDYSHLFIYIDGGVEDAQTYYIDDIKGPALREATAIDNTDSLENLSISPNPATSYIKIQNITNEMVQIFNVSGVLVKQIRNSNTAINIDDLNTGIYFVKVGDRLSKFIRK